MVRLRGGCGVLRGRQDAAPVEPDRANDDGGPGLLRADGYCASSCSRMSSSRASDRSLCGRGRGQSLGWRLPSTRTDQPGRIAWPCRVSASPPIAGDDSSRLVVRASPCSGDGDAGSWVSWSRTCLRSSSRNLRCRDAVVRRRIVSRGNGNLAWWWPNGSAARPAGPRFPGAHAEVDHSDGLPRHQRLTGPVEHRGSQASLSWLWLERQPILQIPCSSAATSRPSSPRRSCGGDPVVS